MGTPSGKGPKISWNLTRKFSILVHLCSTPRRRYSHPFYGIIDRPPPRPPQAHNIIQILTKKKFVF